MKDNHIAVLLEDMDAKFDRMAEAIGSVADDVKVLKVDMVEVKGRLSRIEALGSSLIVSVDDHEGRISRLEAV